MVHVSSIKSDAIRDFVGVYTSNCDSFDTSSDTAFSNAASATATASDTSPTWGGVG